MWKPQGRLIRPNPEIWWMSNFAGPSFPVTIGPDATRLFVTGRDKDNTSRIGAVDVDWSAGRPRIIQSCEPLVDIGALGCFDCDGVAYPWLVAAQRRLYLYYVGWVRGGSVPLHHGIGLAIADSPDGPFEKVSRAPLLPLTDCEPIGTASCCVVCDEPGAWRMFYTSFVRWVEDAGGPKHYYNIRMTRSSDGVHWSTDSELAIDFANDSEYAIGKPCLVHENGREVLYFTARGERYRIWRAVSDGRHFVRDPAPLAITAADWDRDMQAYPVIWQRADWRILFYNGNGYGRTGLGYALEAPAAAARGAVA